MGTMYIVATPIGNREDITVRALKTLSSVDIVLCEDTRKTGMLLSYYRETEPYKTIMGLITSQQPRLISFHEHNEDERLPYVLELLQKDCSLALVSDAGTPLISDPGYKLVRECYRQNIRVVPIPGPSSVITALSASGLPTDSFAFLGYMPKKSGKRAQCISRIQSLCSTHVVSTVVVFETPHRIVETLAEFKKSAPELSVSLAHELTKMHEIFIQNASVGGLPESTKGEYVLLISSDKLNQSPVP